jgi:predicted DsbA family dithiol-disulfide isomerase
MKIEVVSDVICPWCYIGRKRLEKALKILEKDIQPEIVWLPFQLNPDMPARASRAPTTQGEIRLRRARARARCARP